MTVLTPARRAIFRPFRPDVRKALRLALAVAALAGAGCDESNPDVKPFLGTWFILDGNAQAICAGLNPTSPLAGSQVKLTASKDADLVADVRGCLLKFDVAGRTASAHKDQSCKTTFEFMGGNVALDLTVTSASFTLTDDGTNTGMLAMAGDAKIAFLGDTACPYQANATAVKMSEP